MTDRDEGEQRDSENLVIAIDYGTTCTGVAFCLPSHKPIDSEVIEIDRNWGWTYPGAALSSASHKECSLPMVIDSRPSRSLPSPLHGTLSDPSLMRRLQVPITDTTSRENCHSEYGVSSNLIDYEPLTTTESIRLLRLERGHDDDVVSAEFVVSRLDTLPSYTALSYAWGDHDEMQPLEVDQKGQLIGKSLRRMLSAFKVDRRHEHIWIDAICINQNDAMEKASQIKLLARIYQSAGAVHVLLQDNYSNMRGQYHGTDGSHESRPRTHVHALSLDHKNHHLAHQICEGKSSSFLYGLEPLRMLSSHQDFDRSRVSEHFAKHKFLLKTLLSQCNEEDFSSLSITLSAAQTGFRALQVSEIARMTALLLPTGMSLRNTDDLARSLALRGFYQNEKEQYLRNMLQNEWKQVLHIDSQDYVHFKEKSMYMFLNEVSISGIDIKHEVMANACLRELEFDLILAGSDWIVEEKAYENSDKKSDLLAYATDFWHMHLQLAQHTNPALSERLHKLLWCEVQAASHGQSDGEMTLENPCSLQCNNCAELAFVYCDEHGFSELRDFYAQKNDRLRRHLRKTSRAGRNHQLLEDYKQGLSAAFIQCHDESATKKGTDEGWMMRGRRGSTAERTTRRDGDVTNDGSASSVETDVEWVLVDHFR